MDLLIVYLFKNFKYDKNIGLYMYLYNHAKISNSLIHYFKDEY